MERIVIEVDDTLAKAWRGAPENKRKLIRNKINISLAQELMPDSANEYITYLNTLRSEMKSSGLTQNELDNIIADE